MVKLGVDFAESIESVLAKVQETPRGRWFIDGLEAKLRQNDTNRILDAVSRLEDHVHQLSQSNMDSLLVSRARAAIAAARNDISNFENADRSGLSNEAQLFAKLAMKSTTSEPQEKPVSAGIERALKLVSELDRDFSMPAAIKPRNPTRFFDQDAGIFDAPAKPMLKSVPQIATTPKVEVKTPEVEIKTAQPKSKISLKVPSKAIAPSSPVVATKVKTKTPIEQRMRPAAAGSVTRAQTKPAATPPQRKNPTGLRINVAAPVVKPSAPQSEPAAAIVTFDANTPRPAELRLHVTNQQKPLPQSRITINRLKPEKMHGIPLMDTADVNYKSPTALSSH